VSGKFSKVIYVGGEKTSLNDLKRLKSGSINLFGSSAETLFGKKPAGKRDGVLITISQSGKISQLVRSSAIKASRDWQSATETIATTGMVKVSTSTETAITQFTSAFKPTWTLRLAGAGASRVTFGNKLTYLAFTSTSKISGVTGWKPTTPGLVVLAFDSKGAIKSAYNFPGLTTPISLSYSLERGVTGLALSAKNTVSIFQLN
jgi:hypothetical protein